MCIYAVCVKRMGYIYEGEYECVYINGVVLGIGERWRA